MSEYQLVFTEFWQQSKASRLFWIFKPRDPIQWEPFDLYLTFRNDSNQKFEGGKCNFRIQGQLSHRAVWVKLPPIELGEVKTVTVPNIIIAEGGFVALTLINIKTKDGKKVSCRDLKGNDTSRAEGLYPLFLATREEIYQKYAVIVALLFSILAAMLTIVNVLVSIFR